MNVIETHIGKVLDEFTQGEFYNHLLIAKETYFKLTGKLNEDAPDFESRMSTFNDWYVFHYRLDDGRRIIDEYIARNNVEKNLARSFENINYSLFHFVKVNWKKQSILKDILHSRKIIMTQYNSSPSLIPDDLFIGRTVEYQGQSYLLRGVCSIPRDVLGILKKKARKVQKESNPFFEVDFLLGLESLKTKSLNYSHISAEKIFS